MGTRLRLQAPILLVDDEERFVINLAKLLKARGFDVFTVLDGMQAIERLAERAHIKLRKPEVRRQKSVLKKKTGQDNRMNKIR